VLAFPHIQVFGLQCRIGIHRAFVADVDEHPGADEPVDRDLGEGQAVFCEMDGGVDVGSHVLR